MILTKRYIFVVILILLVNSTFLAGQTVELIMLPLVALEAKATSGDPPAMIQLATRYNLGIGVGQNLNKTRELIEKAAAAGNTTAIGMCASSGWGRAKDAAFAFKCFEQSSNEGDLAAQRNLARCYSKGLGCSMNYDKATDMYQKLSVLSGDPASTYALALLYLDTNCAYHSPSGKPVPPIVGRLGMLQAAARLCSVAKVDLADCLERGIGCTRDQRGAIQLYSQAATEGCPLAMRLLGSRYWKGVGGVSRDIVKAKELYRKAGEIGDKEALAWLAANTVEITPTAKVDGSSMAEIHSESYKTDSKYRKSTDTFRSKHDAMLRDYNKRQAESDRIAVRLNITTKYDKEVNLLRSALAQENAKQGADWDALKAGEIIVRLMKFAEQQENERYRQTQEDFNVSNINQPSQKKTSAHEHVTLGIKYEKGDGVAPDIDKANQLYQKAAESGDGKGYNRLGENYLRGNGVPQNIERANALFQKAGELGCGEGYNTLARNYFFGVGVPKNINQAISLFQKAGDLGYGQGYRNIGLAYNNGSGVSQNYERANDYFRKAGDLGDGAGYNMLGVNHIQGLGVSQDIRQANLLFEKAGNLGEPLGYGNLALSYRLGRGVVADANKAEEFESKASALDSKANTKNQEGMTDADALQTIKDDPGALARTFMSGILKELTTPNPERDAEIDRRVREENNARFSEALRQQREDQRRSQN